MDRIGFLAFKVVKGKRVFVEAWSPASKAEWDIKTIELAALLISLEATPEQQPIVTIHEDNTSAMHLRMGERGIPWSAIFDGLYKKFSKIRTPCEVVRIESSANQADRHTRPPLFKKLFEAYPGECFHEGWIGVVTMGFAITHKRGWCDDCCVFAP